MTVQLGRRLLLHKSGTRDPKDKFLAGDHAFATETFTISRQLLTSPLHTAPELLPFPKPKHHLDEQAHEPE